MGFHLVYLYGTSLGLEVGCHVVLSNDQLSIIL